MGKIFKQGLIALAPVAISIAVILWLLRTLEDIFRVPLQWLVGDNYFPGMGLAVAFVFIFFVGIIVNNILVQKMTRLMERLFARIPLFKTLYNSVVDMMNFFKPKDPADKGKMVVVEIDSLRFLALQTRGTSEELPEGFGGEDRVTVFIPFSYQIGGFVTTVPKSRITPLDMSVDQGMRFVVTAGMASGKNQDEKGKK